MSMENGGCLFEKTFEDILKTVTAFANTAGGKIIIGVDDSGLKKRIFDCKCKPNIGTFWLHSKTFDFYNILFPPFLHIRAYALTKPRFYDNITYIIKKSIDLLY